MPSIHEIRNTSVLRLAKGPKTEKIGRSINSPENAGLVYSGFPKNKSASAAGFQAGCYSPTIYM
jgi:hypothetical protein